MEADAARLQPEVAGQQHQIDRHVGVAAEFARQRPVGGLASLGEDPAEDPRTGSLLGDVAQIALAVGREKPDPLLIAVADVGGLFDRVAVADAVGRDAERQHPVEFVARRDVEAGAEVAQHLEHFGRRTGFDRVVDLRLGEMTVKLGVFAADNVEIDHQERRLVLLRLALEHLPLRLGVIIVNVQFHLSSFSENPMFHSVDRLPPEPGETARRISLCRLPLR